MPFVPLTADTGEAQPKQGFTPISTPLEYETSPVVERAKYVAGVIPGVAETAVGGGIDFAGNVGAAVGGMIYGAAPAIWKGQKINWSDPNNPFYQEYAKENSLWQKNISPVLAPQTEAGKDIMGGFTNIAEKMKSMGEKVTDITGSESAGAWTEAALQTLGIPLGLKALGVLPLAGAGVAARMAGKGTPEAVAPESASVADQLKAIRPEAPVKPPETPTAPPSDGEGKGFTPEPTAPVWPEAGAKPTPEQEAQMAKDAEAYRKLQEETKTPEKPVAVPPGAAGFEPKPGDVPTAPRHGVPGVPVQEVPLAGLKLSEEVPQFKKGANKEGIVAPLGGKFDRIGVAPIQIWERLNGDQEIISGRHRWDLAKRSGEETLPAQIHREADGFDAKQAAMMDAELNIRDEQGGVNDYANYFRNSGIDQETANARGLLARAKGKAGWTIGRDASDEVFSAHGAGVISDEAALAFSRAAPKDGPAQAVGLKMINEGRSVQQAENTIRAIAMMEKNGEAKPEQGDIFGFDDSAIRQAEEMAKRASAAQRAIREQLAAVSGATKRPDIARKLGVIVDDPESVKAAIDRLRVALDRLQSWPLYPDLVREFRGEEERPPAELQGETEAEIRAKEEAAKKAKADEEAAAKAEQESKDKADLEAKKKAYAENPENFQFGESSKDAVKPEGDLFAAKTAERRNTTERTAMYGLAKDLAERNGKIGISKLRRHYPQFDEMKAARLIGQLEADGVIGPQNINTGSHELLKGEPVEKAAETLKTQAKSETPAKLSIGRTPNSAEPLSVRDGTIYIGEYPATNFETGEDVTIPEDATPQQIKDALTEAGAIGTGQKIFGMKPAKPHEAEVKPVSDTVKRIMAERERVASGEPAVPKPKLVDRGKVRQDEAAYGNQTDTPEFKKWFGNSKVVDAEGKPLVVYHGARESFSEFRGARSYFAEAPDYAAIYAGAESDDYSGQNLMPVYLNIQRPLDLTALGSERHTWEVLANALESGGASGAASVVRSFKRGEQYVWELWHNPQILRELYTAGFDGVIQIENAARGGAMEEGKAFMVFDPTQIKSAIGNRGTFDPNDPNILNQGRAQYDLFPDVAEKQVEVGMPKPQAEPVTPKQEVKAAREVKLQQNEAEPGIYYVTAKLEKVGERDLPAKITTWQEAANATAYLSRFAVEHFDAIVTDKKGQPLAVIGSFKGATTQTSVYPATVVQELAKIKGAAHLWASHNHPSGTSELSQSDRMISEAFRNLLRGTEVNYHGIMAVGGNRWASDATEFERGDITKVPSEMVRAPIVERVTEGAPNDMMVFSAPRDAKTIVPNLAKDKPGIVVLSAQHNPVAFIPVDPENIFPLRENGRLMKLINSVASTGGAAAILANPKDVMSMRDMNNLGAALGALDVRTLDAISYDPENVATTAKSQADMGTWSPNSGIIQQTHSAYDVNDTSARDLQVHRLQDRYKYSRDEALHDYMTGKRIPDPDYELFGGNKDDVHRIINFNIGITPADLARGAGRIAGDARALIDRAKETQMGAAASEWLDAVKTDIQTKVVPMAAGTDRARAIAKDFANADRLARWQWAKFDDVLKKNFTPEQREKMWNAAEEENQIRMDKVPEAERKGRGINKLTPDERATMDTLHEYGQNLLQRARDVGMFKGEGVAYWSPRIIAMIGEDGTIGRPKAEGGKGFTPYSSPTGGNITVTAGSLKGRKHATVAGTEAAAKLRFGKEAQVVRDIRTMPLAMSKVERAIAGKELINHIKEIGKETGQETVTDSVKPDFFTIDHPAFKTYRYRPDVVQKEAFDKLMMDQLNKFATDIGVKHERVARMGGNIWGKATMGGNKITSRFGGPETVITHEIGHQLDHKYGLAQKFVNAKDLKKELRALADLRYEGAEDQVSNYYKKYVREGSEKIANMVHAYVHAPEKFKAVAPNTYGVFTQFLKEHPELKGLNDIKPSLRLGTGSISKRPPGEDFDVFPVYVSREFEGPLKAIMSDYPGKLYQAMMDMKGKSMSVIMYSPLIHNGVEFGRALPLMPGRIITFKAYFDGAVAKRDPAVMRELINDGMVPIGHRFFMQDISGIMEEPSLKPGRSWTAKIVGGAVGLANKKAGEAVKKGIDVAGDFWHNTLLWDRIGDLQAGIAVNVKADLIKKGMDPQSAGRVAAHLSNRFAGALPNEAMSANARKVANFMFFSRTFTLGNLGVMKDMMSGLPRDVKAQILRDAGPVAAFAAKNAAQHAAIKSFSVDIALMYGANAALQSGFDYLKRDKSLDEIEREYVDRFNNMLQNVKEDPTNLLKPFGMIESLTPMAANEPGKEQRVLYDYDKTGTAIYVRLPTGKIGEEFLSWTTSPLDILKRKEGTVARPLIQTLTNDRGFGRKVYDENLLGYRGAAKAVGNIAYNFMSQQFPIDSLNSALDVARGKSDETDALKVIGPLFGLTFSKGAPGGEEVGMMYTVERMHRAEISDAMPDIKRYIKQGNMDDAIAKMYDAHFTPQEIKATIKFSLMPRARLSPTAMKKFMQTATPEQKQKMQDIRESAP